MQEVLTINPELEKLKQECERSRAQLAHWEQKAAQLEHQLERAKNQERYLSQKERRRRTHHLCNIGGTMEHFFPVTKSLTREELYNLCERLSELPEVQALFRSVHPVRR